MLIGLAGGALWALDTVILGMALALPVFTGDPQSSNTGALCQHLFA